MPSFHLTTSIASLEQERLQPQLFSLPIEDFYAPMTATPSERDWNTTRLNTAAKHLTTRLRELVPLLHVIGFQLEEVTDHEAVGSVPLLPSTMNQNGTHQASIFYIMSDYIAGTAVGAGLAGTYIVGLHDRSQAQPVQLWLKSNAVQHLKPGTGFLRGRAYLEEEQLTIARDRLLVKGRCEVPMHVDIFQGKDLVATANPIIGVYIDNPRLPEHKLDFFQRENSKLSAKMIAGLRADQTSQAVAGEQGRALGLRFSELTPQLPHMVEARGMHLKQHLDNNAAHYTQVVVLGIGLDTTPLHYICNDQRWFGVDLRQTLRIRTIQFQTIGGDSPTLTLVPADLRNPRWGKILQAAGFNFDQATLFIMEGFTPYLHAAELQQLFDDLHSLCLHPHSRIWLDHVTPKLFELSSTAVQDFLSAISRLGEPFVTGFTSIEAICSQWQTVEQCSTTTLLGKHIEQHLVYDEHLMSVVAPRK